MRFFTRWLSLPRRRAGASSLELIDTVPLSTQASVSLIRFERENLVLGVTPQSITVLARRTRPDVSDEAHATETSIP
jgi:flagellar biogenesis protein FliO